MNHPYQPSPDVHVLPTALSLPGVGVLTINAYLLHSEEPVLIDTGIGGDSDDFIDALQSIVDLSKLRWVWLTHDDADHTGSIQRVMELAPQAKLVTHAMSALRMATWWPVPLDRVHAIRFGDEIHAGDRTLRAVQPPLFDNPMSTGILDTSTGALFSVDSFGAIIPEPTDNIAEIPDEALAGGMAGWATMDSPWLRLVDDAKFAQVLDGVRRMQPTSIYSSHLPFAGGDNMERFLTVLATLPDAPPFVAPDSDQFQHMVAAMAAMAGPPPTA
ncbi:MAG TPA: MBL fold metallo-hydrolase [Acidimicrobiales bacterium]|nr:MBL fold metallo-hydrolase [Acidimicrobiales bacterium]